MIPITRDFKKIKPPVVPKEIIIIDDELPDIEIPELIFTSDNAGPDISFEFDTDPEVAEEPDFVIVENMPEYRGKDQSYFQKHLQQLVKYPMAAQEA